MARRKTGGGGGVALGALIVLGMLGTALAEYWPVILLIGSLGLGLWLMGKLGAGSNSHKQENVEDHPAVPSRNIPRRAVRSTRSSDFGISVAVETSAYPRGGERPTSTDPTQYWISESGNANVRGSSLGGLLYVGRGLASVGGGDIEPALINPALSVTSSRLDLSVRRTDYWPSYSHVTDEARAAYLQWLAGGRKDPRADIGLVFLYFYGLERRALADSERDPSARRDLPAIKAEVERLLALYDNRSFQMYGRALLDLLDGEALPPRLYDQVPPDSPRMGLRLKLGLAQCAEDGAPLPSDWALAWLMADTNERIPVAATRCREEFSRLFAARYAAAFGRGLILPKNKTRLRIDYNPASASFVGTERNVRREFNLPDVTVLTSPLKKLREVAEGCCAELSAFSRRSAKAKADLNELEWVADLPYVVWPEKYRAPVEKVRTLLKMSERPVAVPYETVKSWLPYHAALTKPQWRALVGRFAEAGLGVEPDPAVGGPVPTLDTRIVFFELGAEGRGESTSARYMAAAMTLQLAAAVAGADGCIDDLERSTLTARLEEWLHLTAAEKARLHAHLRRLLAAPPKITGLKRQVESLDRTARSAVGTFVVSIALADAVVTKAERKMLERIFKLLELDVATLPTVSPDEPRVVIPAGEPTGGHSILPRPRSTPGFKLDPARVRELQAETERVASLLTGIFHSEDEVPTPAPVADPPIEREAAPPGLWGLDHVHSDLATKLLARAQWSRAELEELAEDREIMLDGALETINEACLDAKGEPLFEGTDPIEVNRSVQHEEAAA